MAIEVIDKIKQKNNGTFKIVDLSDVAYDDNVDAKEKIDSELSRVNTKLNEDITTLTNELEVAKEELTSSIQEVYSATLKYSLLEHQENPMTTKI